MRTMIPVVMVLLAVSLTGCANKNIVGHWRGIKVDGGNPRTFSIGTIEFKEDNTFGGIITVNEKKDTLDGTYRFNGMSLTLDTAGGVHKYPISRHNAFKHTITFKHNGIKAKIERVGK